MFDFTKNIWGVTKKVDESLLNVNFLEQEFKNFKQDKVSNGEYLEDDNNGIENSKLWKFQPQSCGH